MSRRPKRREPATLIAFGVSAASFTARFGVEPFSHPCSKCGRILTTSLPFARGTLRGLRAPACACGNELTPYALILGADLDMTGESPAYCPPPGSIAAVVKLADRRGRASPGPIG